MAYRMAYRNWGKRVKQVAVSYPAANVWAAAAMVFRTNGGYFKETVYEHDQTNGETCVVKEANKKIVNALLQIGEEWTDEDVRVATEARSYWQGGIMKLLADAKISDFEKQAIMLAEKEEINTFFDIAVISSLIGAAKRGAERDQIENEKRTSLSKWLGITNEKIHLDNLTVISCVYITSYNSYRNEGTQNGNYVSWWSKEKLEVGKTMNVTARVKATVIDEKTGAKTTQVNYLKAVKK